MLMNGWLTCVDMNVIPLGSYDVLIGMDWLEVHIPQFAKHFHVFEEHYVIFYDKVFN